MSINIEFPLQDDTVTNNFFKTTETTAQGIKSNLYLLLTTDVNTRFYNRGYGSNLKKYLFDPNTSKTELDITAEIKTIVSQNISNLTITNVTYETPDTNTILITVYFTYSSDFYSFADAIAIQF
jgi:phage baseplate assembly protein W